MEKVLIIGSGGREHSLAKYISQSDRIREVFVAPGNAGIKFEKKCLNININISNHNEVVKWVSENSINLVVVGPEEPLINGLADKLNEHNIKCFGPKMSAAMLEGSKYFSKTIMGACNIPTAYYKKFTDKMEARLYLKDAPDNMRVIKADGIAAGKGVIIAENIEQAYAIVDEMLDENEPKFGKNNSTIIIEELLEGPEISILAFSDGWNVRCFPPSQDHKKIYDGDKGPNTGGMGAYCPCNLINEKTFKSIETNIVEKTVRYLYSIGLVYQGIIYVGLIMTKSGPYVLEYNCRFGDPETQVILPLLKSDLYEIMLKCTELNGLANSTVEFYSNMYSLCVVMVSGGYPDSYKKGIVIKGLSNESSQNLVNNSVQIIHAGTQHAVGSDQSNQILTNGGRVLAVVGCDNSLEFCYNRVMQHIKQIEFQGAFYRRDIAWQARYKLLPSQMTYASAGVSIQSGDELVRDIKQLCDLSKRRPGVYSEIGQFGALFDLKQCGFKDPILVSGTDGVGTKLKIAELMQCHSTIGQDLVAMCVNDVLCHGAEPLYFLDYYASGRLNVATGNQILRGINTACIESGCALIGGETAEMPGIYYNDDYDLAGFVVGAVERSKLLPRLEEVRPGDFIIGIGSCGLHSNGYSLARKILECYGHHNNLSLNDVLKIKFGDDGSILGEQLLRPTRLYVKSILSVLQSDARLAEHIRSICHITGGGLVGNVCRSIPTNECIAQLNCANWPIPPVIQWLWANSIECSDEDDFAATFNLGIGLVLVVSEEKSHDICAALKHHTCDGEQVYVGQIGQIVSRKYPTDYPVVLNNLLSLLGPKNPQLVSHIKRKRVGVLISGSGTNLEALLKYERKQGIKCGYEIVSVISNKPGVRGLEIASKYGVPSRVVSHKDFADRETFDKELNRVLSQHQCEFLCLAGFMRLLSGWFVQQWYGRAINIHPSLLPSFKGAHAHRDVLASGVRITGATVHYVTESMDSGGIIMQDSIPICHGDNEESLSERVKIEVEHRIYPHALETVTRGLCQLDANNTVQWIY